MNPILFVSQERMIAAINDVADLLARRYTNGEIGQKELFVAQAALAEVLDNLEKAVKQTRDLDLTCPNDGANLMLHADGERACPICGSKWEPGASLFQGE
jgi:hypothetical protein